ncbi:hypothetical protein LEP3755_40430 [Leptolyngbya sp. NIES-3755]|nr:hypothetical protein LEP3755_40430 [Leptolyngbya sp. NIES-3755]
MGIDIFWWFYKVEPANFEAVQSEFQQAAQGVSRLPEVSILAPRPKAPPVTQDYIDSVVEGSLTGGDLTLHFCHEPFSSIAYQILETETPLLPGNCIEMVILSRVAPPVILLMGIGYERFSQLPGYLGNMLIHPNEVEQTIELVSQVLDVDWESYFEKAKLGLDYAGFDDHATEDVSQVLQALPTALEQAKSEGTGLLAVTSWGIP